MIIWRNPGSPQIRQSQLHLAHPRQDGRGGVDGRARQGLVVVGVSGVPERLATRKSKAVECPSRGEGFSLWHREPAPAYHVVYVAEFFFLTLEDNPGGQLTPDALHLGESQSDREVAVSTMFD